MALPWPPSWAARHPRVRHLDGCSIMRRAAARAVMKLVRSPLMTARRRSSVSISTRGVPCASPRVMRLNEMVDVAGFRDHVLDVTFHRALVSASSSDTSADPPADLMSFATASSFARVRPTRKTLAPRVQRSERRLRYPPPAP